MAAVALVEATAADLEAGDATHVHQVRQRLHLLGGLGKQAVADEQFGVIEIRGEDAGLVVDEDAVAHLQSAALEANAGAVVIGGACATELDVVDEDVAVGDDPDRLALGDLAIGDQHRAFADAADHELLLAPGCDVAAVLAREDLDDVAVPGRLGGRRCG